ncbi:MAG: 4Fe-4S dicluster domain-containing protein [Chloroflexi bacterium]|nr:4Fe-4S dicluster domain-containing protein [Chloroflexota bacterium]
MSEKRGLSRRDFLKIAGATGGVASLAGVGLAGWDSGATGQAHTGWQSEQGLVMFNREPFRVDKPTYGLAKATPDRLDGREVIFNRDTALKAQWYTSKKGEAGLDAWMKDYYAKFPDKLQLDRVRNEKIEPERVENQKKYGSQYIMSQIWSAAWSAVSVPRSDLPEKTDLEGVQKPAYKIKDPAAMSNLIKKVTMTFGATMVGIAKFNPAWVYSHAGADGRGYKRGDPINIPDWWQYAIAFGVPHEWDIVKSNPTYGTSSDAYNRSSIAAARLVTFIKRLGYAAREESPNGGYDTMVPPILIDAGLGEQGRFGFCITPEAGGNFRPAVVFTNLPLVPDKPINMGLKSYCMECKICAEQCPSRAIPFDEPKEIRGVVKWTISHERCFNYWRSVVGSGSCRICLALCPWSRKDAWLYNMTKAVLSRDPTGLMAKMSVEAQKFLYENPDPQTYYAPTNASVRPPEWWMRNDPFIEVPSAQGASAPIWDALQEEALLNNALEL